MIGAAEGGGDADPAADDGEDGEDDEGEEHDPGGFVDAVRVGGLACVVFGDHDGVVSSGVDGGAVGFERCCSKRGAPKKVLNQRRNM